VQKLLPATAISRAVSLDTVELRVDPATVPTTAVPPACNSLSEIPAQPLEATSGQTPGPGVRRFSKSVRFLDTTSNAFPCPCSSPTTSPLPIVTATRCAGPALSAAASSASCDSTATGGVPPVPPPTQAENSAAVNTEVHTAGGCNGDGTDDSHGEGIAGGDSAAEADGKPPPARSGPVHSAEPPPHRRRLSGGGLSGVGSWRARGPAAGMRAGSESFRSGRGSLMRLAGTLFQSDSGSGSGLQLGPDELRALRRELEDAVRCPARYSWPDRVSGECEADPRAAGRRAALARGGTGCKGWSREW
jgi:hypothetical protein